MAQDRGGTLSSFRRDHCAERYLGGHPSIFLPTKVLDLWFTVLQSPTKTIINQIEDQLWSQLMSENKKRSGNLMNFITAKPKHSSKYCAKKLEYPCYISSSETPVRLIVEKKGEDPPGDPPIGTIYAGDLSSIPATMTGITA